MSNNNYKSVTGQRRKLELVFEGLRACRIKDFRFYPEIVG